MFNAIEKKFFLENGYLVVENVLSRDHLERVQQAFDQVWQQESAPYNQHKLLKFEVFRELIEHPPILERHRAGG